MTGSSSGPTQRGTRTGRGRERADMISSVFPSIVPRPDGSSSCFPSRRWGKSRVGAERRSGDPGVRTLAPDSLRNLFRDPERETPAQRPLALPRPSPLGPRALAGRLRWRLAPGPARQAGRALGRAMLGSFHEGAGAHWLRLAGPASPGFGAGRGGNRAGGSPLTGARDQFRLNGGNLRPRPLCARLFCPSVS